MIPLTGMNCNQTEDDMNALLKWLFGFKHITNKEYTPLPRTICVGRPQLEVAKECEVFVSLFNLVTTYPVVA
jgi:hypothetical protein